MLQRLKQNWNWICRVGEANLALELYTTAWGEGIKPNLIMCDSITGASCNDLFFNHMALISGKVPVT